MSLYDTDKKFLARDGQPDDIEIAASEGNYLIDVNGKKYIDFYMGWCIGNIGWGNQEILNSVKNFQGPDYVPPSFLYKPWAELAELLAEITPGKLSKSFRATGGTEAVEIALCIANAYTGKNKFISIENSYHGNSIGAMSVGSSSYKKKQPGLLLYSYKIKPPLDKKAIKKVEQFLKKGDVAALIMEPIICNLSVLIPEPEFILNIQALCKKYGALLIMDEVATGFGRTGKLFASEHFGIEPDIMTMAKAMTGGYASMGATIVTPKVAKVVEPKAGYYSTYGWHPLSVEAALANIKYILKHQKTLENNTAVMSNYFYQRLSILPFKYPAEVRIKGLAIGVEFKKAKYARKIVANALNKGLLISPMSDHSFSLFPALNIDKETAQTGLDILEKCI